MRTKKSFYNLLATSIPQLCLAFIALFRTKYFLQYLGDEIYGLYQLFGQILAYFSLADLGVTEAIHYFLYKPISDNNKEQIGKILAGAKKVFNKIAIFIFIVGLCISPFLNFFIKDNMVSNIFIISSFLIMLIANLINYFVTPFTLMLDSSQEKYKYSFYIQLVLIIRYIIEIIVVILTKNLHIILLIELTAAFFQNVVIKRVFKKNYKDVSLNVKPDMSFKRKLNSIIPHKISSVISNSMDILLVSNILGINFVPVYTCNYFITNMLNQIIGKISSSTLASVGNLLVSSKEKAYNIFLEYNNILFMIATIVCVPLLCVMNSFVELWYGIKYVVPFYTTIIFVLLLFYNIIRIVLNNFSSSAGLYKETLVCTLLEAFLNLCLSLILIHKYNIFGIILGTLLSFIISEFCLKPRILNKYIFNKKIRNYYFECLMYFLIFIINSILCVFLIKKVIIKNLFNWLLCGILIFILNLILTFIEYKILKKNYLIDRIKELLRQLKAN